MSSAIRYVTPGCVVEYLEGNAVQIAFVTEVVAERLRLLLPNRRETKLSMARLLPWSGPQYSSNLGREEIIHLLEEHKQKRNTLEQSLDVMEIWEMAQGEVNLAPAQWFAELFSSEPDFDLIAAYGHALLSCKTHFRFQPPDFQVFTKEEAEKKQEEQKKRQVHEALVTSGANFFQLLWQIAGNKRNIPSGQIQNPNGLTPELLEELEALLHKRMLDPDAQATEATWKMLSKGLPEVPHLPLMLLTAWGKVPPHYNFWLERADYQAGDTWWLAEQTTVHKLQELAHANSLNLPLLDLPFISIDSATTKDIDDAFYICREETGYLLTLALAFPSMHWPFGSELDKLVLHRGTSLYLPEGDCHMLPECLGTEAYSLQAGQIRPAFCVQLHLDANGEVKHCQIIPARVCLAANLNYNDCQAVLDNATDNPAGSYQEQLVLALEFARKRQALRIASGAVVMDRLEQHILLTGEGDETVVQILTDVPTPEATLVVSESMIVAGAAVAEWAKLNKLPVLHRTQDVTLPQEYAGIWNTPQDITRVMRVLIPSALEVKIKPHAALALPNYIPVTSPLRRYSDLVNVAQIAHFVLHGQARWSENELEDLLKILLPVLDSVTQVQRFRIRYWKLLFFRQQGDDVWWSGVISEENENYVNVSLDAYGIFVRGKRNLFEDKACPGLPVQIRIGKVQPLWNEIQILEARSEEKLCLSV